MIERYARTQGLEKNKKEQAMKYYIVTMLLWVGAIQAFSQQPV